MKILVKSFFSSPHLIRYFKNTIWVFLDFVLKQGIGILVGVLMARYLMPKGLGVLSFATIYLLLLEALAHGGLSGVITRELVSNQQNYNRILGTAFIVRLITSTIGFILLTAIVWVKKSEYSGFILITSLSVFFSPFHVIQFYFNALVKAKYAVYATQAAGLMAAALKLYGIYMGLDVAWFVWVILIEAALLSLMLVVFYRFNQQYITHWQFDKPIAKALLKELPPVILTGIFVALYMRIDQLMIFEMMDAAALGVYAAAVKLCDPFYMVAILLTTSLFPAIINGLAISQTEYKNRLQRLFNLLTFVALLGSVAIHILAEPIIYYIYGNGYEEAANVLKIYFWASIMVFQGVVAGQAYTAEKIQIYGTVFTLIGAALNIGLNLYWIPIWGLAGSAWATLVSYFVSSILLNAFFAATRPIFIQQLKAFGQVFNNPIKWFNALKQMGNQP